MNSGNSKHALFLDSLRGLAAQAVLLGHAHSAILGESTVNAVLGWGSFSAVLLFFVLSGYVICASLLMEISKTGRVNLSDFALRRVARIMPPFLFTIAFVTLFFSFTDAGSVLAEKYNLSWWSAIRSSVFAFTSTDAIALTPVWSLRLEVGLYIFSGLIAAIWVSSGFARIVLCSVLAGVTAIFCWKLSFAGIAIATYGLGAALAFYMPLKIWAENSSSLFKCTALTGGYSYTLYLMHMPVILIVGHSTRGITAFSLAVLVSNIVAICVAWLVERPKQFASLLRAAFSLRFSFAKP